MNIYKPSILDRLNNKGKLVAFEVKLLTLEPLDINHLERFKKKSIKNYNKFFFGKRTNETKNNYLLCWYDSMKSILIDYNISREQFLSD